MKTSLAKNTRAGNQTSVKNDSTFVKCALIVGWLGLAVLLLSSCAIVPIPVGGSKPFQEEAVRNLEVGKSRRVDVLIALGEPRHVFDDERLFIYAEGKLHAVMLILVPNTVAGAGLATQYFLAAKFNDNGVLSHIEAMAFGSEEARQSMPEGMAFYDDVACTTWGLCLISHQGDVALY